jgi:hypothetical protein
LERVTIHAYIQTAYDDCDDNIKDVTTVISDSKLILLKGVTLMNISKGMEMAGGV